ncbi:MAG TPA: tetratricopeptide repeat protein, partial [Thermoanaerobaculia bacterium]|nr:tetratricopeptide repeat protein [Thermoanaerobaculia bacterium]
LVAELVAHPPARREVLVANSERFRSLALAERLVDAAFEARFADPAETVALGRLALAVLAALDRAFYGERRIADVEGRAWVEVGSGLRIGDDLVAAEAAFAEAERRLAGTTDPAAEAGRLHALSSLRKDQRRFLAAEELLARAAELYEEVGDDERRARVLTGLGSLHLDRGEPEAARPPLLEAMRLVDPLGDPRTALFIRHNLALSLVETGRADEAERVFRAGFEAYAEADRWTRLKGRWLAALLAVAAGRDAEAEAALVEIEAAYAEGDRPYDAALAALDLAGLYARQRRDGELKALARRLVPLFASHGIHREAITALAFFLQAAERERASVEVVDRVAGFLKRARLDPTLRFRTAG